MGCLLYFVRVLIQYLQLMIPSDPTTISSDPQTILTTTVVAPDTFSLNVSDTHSPRQHRQSVDLKQSIVEESKAPKVNLQDSILHPQSQNIDQIDESLIEKEERHYIPPEFYYEDKHRETVFEDSPIEGAVAEYHHSFGFDSLKKFNIQILDKDNIIYASGTTYTIYNTFTNEATLFFSQDRGGIGSIAVHPEKKYFAVAEKGQYPNIYIYQYPSLRLYRIMRKGTERSYSKICFNADGSKLASVGSKPDYQICVWDWMQEVILLKSKAFSQQVYNVSFCHFNEAALITSGMGHIKFWKVSETFTGLKLQGEIAKFGQIELSDVSAFIDFEDGKVLSSSEYGKLLLWQGNLIKCVISIDQNTLCHNGAIEVIMLFKKQIVSAGGDGYIKFWDYDAVNNSESDEQFNFYLKPTHEIYLEREEGLPAHIIHIIENEDMWIVQDALGKIWKVKVDDFSKTEIMETNSGKLNNMVLSPISNTAVTVGSDGYVRVWDYGNKVQFYCKNFLTRSEATTVQWIPYSKKNAGRMLAVGFSDGLIRFLILNQSGFQLVKVFKIHKRKITHTKCSPDGVTLAVVDENGDIFLCSLNSSKIQDIVPYCLYETKMKVNDICWDRDSTKILLGCRDGTLAEIKILRPQQCDNSETYLKPHNARTYLVKMMESQKPKKEDLQLQLLLKKTRGGNVDDKIVDQEWEPSPVLSVLYYDNECSKVLCAVDGKFLGHLYIVDWAKDRPINSIKVSKQQISNMSINEQVLIMGFTNGSFQLRHKYNYQKFLLKFPHDRDIGRVSKVLFNHQKNSLLTTSEDGTIFVYKIDYGSFCRAAKSLQPLDVGSIMIPTSILGLNEVSFIDKLETDQTSDMSSSAGYSIQEEKLKAEEDNKMSEADKVKLAKRRKIKELQNIFNEIVATNSRETDEIVKLSREELVVDPQYVDILRTQVEDEIEETRKELEYDQTYSKLLKDKIEDYMINELEYDKFIVSGIKKESLAVQSFKLKRMSEYMKSELIKINRIIEEEKVQEVNFKRSSIDNLQLMQGTRNSFNRTGNVAMSNANITGKGRDFHGKIREAEEDFEKELQEAEMTKGDYKLKSSKDYSVPENQRLNIARKKKHMFVHYNYLFTSKKQFNDKLADLRSRKEKITEKILKFNKVFEEINASLSIEETLFVPKVETGKDSEITSEEIEEYARVKKAKENKRGSVGGMGGADGAPVEKPRDRKKSLFINKEEPKDKQGNKPRKGMKVQISELQNEQREINEIRLISKKSRMNKELQKDISEFDRDLNQLKLRKGYLEIDLRQIEMKLLTEYQEYLIFADMEDEDNKLLQRLNSLKQDKITHEITVSNLLDQIAEIQAVTQDLKHKVQEQKRVFKELVFPDDDEKRQKILRYYKNRERKRLNKARRQNEKEKNENSEEESESNSEENSEEDDEDDEEDEFDEDEEKPDITPIETDHKNFDLIRKICQHDQKIDENTRQKNDLQKQKNQIGNKIKGMLTELLKVDSELKVLEKKKLVKINLLDVTYPVSISQINHLVKVGGTYSLPQDLNSSIMFTYPSYDRLGNRIKELKKEKVDIEKKQLMLEKQLGRLKNQVKKASIDIENKRKEEEEKQLLKFGDTIDLKILEALEPTTELLDTRQRYKVEQKEVSRRIQEIKHQLQLKKKDLLSCKKQNTKVITQITQLGEKQMQLNKKLDSTNKQLFRGEDEDKKNDMDKEKSNLKDLIKFLSKEIEDLKTEIGLFKRKGGHIYTMVTSNKRNFT